MVGIALNTDLLCYSYYYDEGTGDSNNDKTKGGGVNTSPTTPKGFNPCDRLAPLGAKTKSTISQVLSKPVTDSCDVDCAGVPGGSAYIDPNCNTCIGGTTGLTSCSTIDLSLLDRFNYPVLGKIVDNLYNKVKNDPKLLTAIKKFSHLTTNEILNNLKSGQGPKLAVSEKLAPNKIGEFKNNTIYLNKNHITQSSYVYKDYSTALEFYIAVSILHEFIHFGENYSQIFLPHEGNKDDVGFQFENDLYGGRVYFNTITGKIEYEKL